MAPVAYLLSKEPPSPFACAVGETFTAKVKVQKSWEPGMDATYLAADGIEYAVGADAMPDDNVWNEMLAKAKERGTSREVMTLQGVPAVLEKKFLTPAQKRAMYGTLQIRLRRAVWQQGRGPARRGDSR